MFTSAHANRSAQASAPAGHYAHRSGEQNTNGLISEIVYREDQPMMTQLLLLPLLQQLGQQSRWQLWLTPQQSSAANGFSPPVCRCPRSCKLASSLPAIP